MTEPVDTTSNSKVSRRYPTRFAILVLVIAAIVLTLFLLLPTPSDQAFRWFSALGFPDVKGRPFVRVATGHWVQYGDAGPTNQYIDGFLLHQSNGAFTVLTKDLFIRPFTNTAPGTAAHEEVGYETLDLAKESGALLKTLRNSSEDNWRRFGQRLPERAEAFVLSWGCARNGHSANAQRLFEQASVMCESVPVGRNWWQRIRERIETALRRPAKKLQIQDQMERDLGHAMMWRAVEAFGDPSVSRRQLLNQFTAIISNYPGSEHIPRARDTAAILDRMIKEDEARPIVTAPRLELAPIHQQVAGLIFRLRDQNGQQFSQPGWCDIFQDFRGTTNTPAHELVHIGHPAVPQLIAAIDDQTLTRSVGYHRNFYFSHTVLTVGDCAIAILQRITGKSFYGPKTTSSYPSNDGGTSPARNAAEAWWAEFQAKGERQALIDAVASGSDDAPAQAALLIKGYSTDAPSAIARGARASAQEWTRTRLVELAAGLADEELTNFLGSEMLQAPGLETRVAAAHALRKRGVGESVTAMLREWDQLKDSPSHDGNGQQTLIAFLAGTDAPEAIRALGRALGNQKVDTRLEVVESLGRWNEELSVATLAAVEEELVKALEDTEERTGMSGSWGEKKFSDPRVCDFAGYFLVKRWPDRYVFDLSGALKIRDRQRVECQNVWRRAHGLEELPLPTPRTTIVRPEDCNKVTTIQWEEESEKQAPMFAARITALHSQDLIATNFIELLTGFAATPIPNTSGLILRALKDDDLMGVLIIVRLLPGTPLNPKSALQVNQRVTLGARTLRSSSGGGSFEHYASWDGWQDFAEAATEALAAPPKTPFVISAKISGEK